MVFKDPHENPKSIPVKFRGAFVRWAKIKNTPLKDRLWPYVSVGKPEDCWEFSGKTRSNRGGYGVITISAKPRVRWLAHRLAWTVANGPIPEGLFVCHKCDNPPCCNPDHLFLGTQKDNMGDCSKKGRLNPNRGEKSYSCILNESQVIQIRKMHVPHVVTYKMIAKMFGVSKSCIQHILSGRKWKHVP